MNSSRPNTWTELPLGTLNQFSPRTIDPSSYPLETFELYSVPSFPSGKPEVVSGNAIGSTKQVVQPGDVLVCKINPRINRVWQVQLNRDLKQIGSSEWIGFRVIGLDPRFFRHYFTSPEFRELICSDVTGVGGSLTRAQPKKVATFPVPLAPLPEQTRIADKLDAVLARVDACRDRLDRVPGILKRFRQAVLDAATSGKLTEDWRADQTARMRLQAESGNVARDAAELRYHVTATPDSAALNSGDGVDGVEGHDDLPASWIRTVVGAVGTVSNGSTPSRKVAEYWGGNISWVSSGEVRNTVISNTRERITRAGLENSSVRLLPKGAVLLAMIGEGKTRGQSALLDIEACINQNIAGVVVRPDLIVSRYLWFWFQGQYENNRMVGSGTGPQALNCQRVRALPVNLPPKVEQTEIVHRVEALFAYADRLDARYKTARAQVEKLTPALLVKAFRGELVPQDPNDEPAAELLARLHAARARQPAASKRGRKATPSAGT